jgi:colicin import membrane protein
MMRHRDTGFGCPAAGLLDRGGRAIQPGHRVPAGGQEDRVVANQDKLDADAMASVARADAAESARAATAAREQARATRAQAAQKEFERAAERTAHEQAIQELRGELEQARADAGAEMAAAREQLAAAEARTEQRTAERAAERAAHEQAMQRVRNDVKQARADAAAEVAAAREQVLAAETRAEQRTAERAAEREHAEEAMQRPRGELEQARADAAADVAATRGWANGEVDAARDAADAQIARARAAADDAIRQAQAADARAASTQLLSIPIPPLEIRAQTLHIENALNALQHIDHVLEVGMADDFESQTPPDAELIHSLVRIVQDHAMYLSNESRNAHRSSQVDAAATYAQAAAAAFCAFLQRIEAVARRLHSRDRRPDAEIIEAVTAMLADPWVEDIRSLGPES